MEKKISVVGGDLRNIRLVDLFTKDGYRVFVYGQEKYEEGVKNSLVNYCDTLEECIEKTDIIIAGMPFSKNKKTLFMPFSEKEVKIETFYHLLKDKKLIAGGIPSCFFENPNIDCVDLLNIEELTILNAIPTVEGAIKILIEETEITIHESNILVLGFGRIGKILCKRLKDLGANVYCAARKDSDLAWIREERCIPISYDEIEEYGFQIDVVINTVPMLILDQERLANFHEKTMIIDLASLPGGVDKKAAERYKIRVITALGIPGKVAPLTAAKYIKKIIEKYVGGKL